jgi:hypothetical protein
MKRFLGAVLGALALAACETTETLAYQPPVSGPTATVTVSRERLIPGKETRVYITEPGGAVRWRLGAEGRYEYNQRYTVPAGAPTMFEIETGDDENSDNYVIGSMYYTFTPVAGATYLFRPFRAGEYPDGKVPGLIAPVMYPIVDAATDQPPPDIKQQLMP